MHVVMNSNAAVTDIELDDRPSRLVRDRMDVLWGSRVVIVAAPTASRRATYCTEIELLPSDQTSTWTYLRLMGPVRRMTLRRHEHDTFKPLKNAN